MSKAGVKQKMTQRRWLWICQRRGWNRRWHRDADYGYVKGGGETEDDIETLTMDMLMAGVKQKMTQRRWLWICQRRGWNRRWHREADYGYVDGGGETEDDIETLTMDMSNFGVKQKMTQRRWLWICQRRGWNRRWHRDADYGYVDGGGETEDDTETLTMDMSKAGVKQKMTQRRWLWICQRRGWNRRWHRDADYGYVKGGGETEDDTETLTVDMSKAGVKQKMT